MKRNIQGIHILLGALPVNGRSIEELARIAVVGGASVVQLREKQMPMDELLPIAKKMRLICKDINFIVNDRTDLAKIVEADGVHLGQDDLPIEYAREILGKNARIGISCGSIEEARQAEKDGADYIGFGHLFPTSSKVKSSPPKTLDNLKIISFAMQIPVIAIGGITVINAPSVLKCTSGGIAVLGAFSQSQNPREVIQLLANMMQK